MTTLSVSDVQKAVRSLPATEFSVFSEWFDTYEHARWDDRLASDQQTSPALLSAIEEAKTDFRDGQCTSL